MPDGDSEKPGDEGRQSHDASCLEHELPGTGLRDLHDGDQWTRTTIMLGPCGQSGSAYQARTDDEVSERPRSEFMVLDIDSGQPRDEVRQETLRLRKS